MPRGTIYSFCVIPALCGIPEDPILGFTVAHSEAEAPPIIRRHISPHKTFSLRSLTACPFPPEDAANAVEHLEGLGFVWLDPRGPAFQPVRSVSDVVTELMTAGHAL